MSLGLYDILKNQIIGVPSNDVETTLLYLASVVLGLAFVFFVLNLFEIIAGKR